MMLSHSQETLLIVDDEPMMTDLFRQSMTKRGFHVLTAAGGPAAQEIVAAEGDALRLVITDMTMPGMDGVSLARVLNEKAPNLPVLIATGHETDAEQMGLPPNVVGVVSKPYQHKALAERIRAILDNGKAQAK